MYKPYSDSHLMSLTRAEIIELLRTAEHNFFAMEEALNNSAKAGMEIAEKYDEAKRLLKVAMEELSLLNNADVPCIFERLGDENVPDRCKKFNDEELPVETCCYNCLCAWLNEICEKP